MIVHETLKRVFFTGYLATLCVCAVNGQQIPGVDLTRHLPLLQADRELATKILSPNTFSIDERDNTQTFYRQEETVGVTYSTGTCGGVVPSADGWITRPDIWDVSRDKVVWLSYQPKGSLKVADLGVDLTNYAREKIWGDRSAAVVYFSRKEGLAITAWGQEVEAIEFFPKNTSISSLCPFNAKKYQAELTARRARYGHRFSCLLFNQTAHVRQLDVQKNVDASRKFGIKVTAEDPENDVLTYEYVVTAGKIIGKGSTVSWDLSGEPKGIYTIKAAVDDGAGPIGVWMSQTVIVD